ncbi:MAG: hypothetical protein ACPID1_01890, partial [Poseidonia sp.]
MTNRAACGFALLLLVQAMSAALYVLPTEYEQNDWQGPVFESGARSNNSSSGCGYDVNYTSLYTNAPTYVLSTSTVSVWINTYCDLLNTPMYLTASLANQNNGSTYGVANASYNGSNVSFSSNWSIPASTLGVGNYTLTATLQYYDGSTWTTIETDTHNFSIIAPVTNPCGVDPNSASVYAYSYSTGYQLGSNFTGAITTYCSITNATMVVDWTIRSLTTNASIDSGSFNWTGVNTSVGHNVTSTALASMGVGNYSFEATLSWYNNSSMAWEVLDIDSYAFFVYNNTNSGPGSLGCGYDLNYTDVYAYAPYYGVVNQSIDTTMYVQCPVYNASMFLNYWIYDASNTTLDSGNYSWTASTNQTWHYWNATSLAAGNYIFHVELYSNGSYVTSDSDGFTVMNNNTGNNTGGNGTGNNTGGNNTGGNNTGNNSTHNVAHCLHLRNISVDSSYYVSVDLENTCSTDINYPGINASTNDPGVSGLSDTWWYLLWANGTYNSGWQLSFNQSVQNNTLITLNFNATILNCGPNGYHACP